LEKENLGKFFSFVSPLFKFGEKLVTFFKKTVVTLAAVSFRSKKWFPGSDETRVHVIHFLKYFFSLKKWRKNTTILTQITAI
jgi:hypothetical protein